MRVLIIEDEIPSQLNLKRALAKTAPDLTVVECIGSVADAVEWFENNPHGADLVFMDVQLSDGLCFDIFKQTTVCGKVVITTAYDSYALDAFKIHSVDYLLKPLDEEALRCAVEHCRSLGIATPQPTIDYSKLAELFTPTPKNQYKDRFVVKIGDKIVPIKTENIAFFYSESKTSHIVTDEGREYVIDDSLDTVENKINPELFFRIGRSFIVSLSAIHLVTKHFGSRLKVQLKGNKRDDLFVSRSRTNEFLEWLGGE
ncbi:MAG: response regulator transcription factor [Tidjanibacter sp.]|nr:response regulator transcription factor [Tidjanibacter sp.]